MRDKAPEIDPARGGAARPLKRPTRLKGEALTVLTSRGRGVTYVEERYTVDPRTGERVLTGLVFRRELPSADHHTSHKVHKGQYVTVSPRKWTRTVSRTLAVRGEIPAPSATQQALARLAALPAGFGAWVHDMPPWPDGVPELLGAELAEPRD